MLQQFDAASPGQGWQHLADRGRGEQEAVCAPGALPAADCSRHCVLQNLPVLHGSSCRLADIDACKSRSHGHQAANAKDPDTPEGGGRGGGCPVGAAGKARPAAIL